MEKNKTRRFIRFKVWYSRNRPFVAFFFTLIATGFVTASIIDELYKTLSWAGLVLQLWGLLITASGIFGVRQLYGYPRLGQILKWFLFIREKPEIDPAGQLVTLKQTVLQVSPIKLPANDRLGHNTVLNISTLCQGINEDRQSIKCLGGLIQDFEARIDNEILKKLSQLEQHSKVIHVQDSGLSLAGLCLVAVGMICSAWPSLI